MREAEQTSGESARPWAGRVRACVIRRAVARTRGYAACSAPRWPSGVRAGYRRLHALLRRQGERINPKRVYRLYRDEGLHLRKADAATATKRAPAGVLLPCSHPNQRWSLDFMHDSLGNGRKFRLLNVIDDCTRMPVHRNLDGLQRTPRHARTRTAVSGARCSRRDSQRQRQRVCQRTGAELGEAPRHPLALHQAESRRRTRTSRASTVAYATSV